MTQSNTINENFSKLKSRKASVIQEFEIDTDNKVRGQIEDLKRSTFDRSKFTVVNTPTIAEDGIASGFNHNNYIRVNVSPSNYSTWELTTPIVTFTSFADESGYQTQAFLGCENSSHTFALMLRQSGNIFQYRINNTGENFGTVKLNTPYQFKIKYTGAQYLIYSREVGQDFSLVKTVNDSNNVDVDYLLLGIPNYNNNYYGLYNGSLDLKTVSLIGDGIEVFNGNKTGVDQIKKDDYTVVGTPNISQEGILSNTTSSSYLKANELTVSNTSNIVIEGEFKLPSDYTSNQWILSQGNYTNGLAILVNGTNKYIGIFLNNQALQERIRIVPVDKDVYFKISINNKVGSLTLTPKDETDITLNFNSLLASDFTYTNNLLIGSTTNQGGFNGEINLNKFKVYVDGKLVYQPTLRIPYTQSKTGSKVVDATYRNRVQDMYEQFGYTEYYTVGDIDYTLPTGNIYETIRESMQKAKDESFKPSIFEFKWTDHKLNDIQWLRSDTFSWQSGNVYKTAYDKLSEEYATGVEKTEDGITFKQTTNGFKIADVTQEIAILNKYRAEGIAWFYILDTANRRFKLPRMKYKYWKNQSALPVKGNGMTLGLYSGTNNYGLVAASSTSTGLTSSSGAIGQPVGSSISGSSFSNVSVGVTTDSTKSGLVANISNAMSELPMYLYFYVGEYARPAIEQTAGITTEMLNSKVDIETLFETPVIIDTVIEGSNGYIIWDNGYCEQWGKWLNTGTVTEVSITLSKTYRDTNYNLLTHAIMAANANTYTPICLYDNVTRDTFTIYNASMNAVNRGFYWKTCGYLLEGQY